MAAEGIQGGLIHRLQGFKEHPAAQGFSVAIMTNHDAQSPDASAFHALLALQTSGIAIVAGAAELAETSLINYFPKPLRDKIKRLVKVYFTPCPSPKKQRDAIEAARVGKHSLETLASIETRLARLSDDSDIWAHRLHLCSLTGSHAEITAAARELVEQLNTAIPPSEEAPSIRFTRRPQEMRASLHLEASEAEIASIRAALADDAGPGAGASELAAAFFEMLKTGMPEARIVNNVIIKLEDFLRVVEGEGDEIILASLNGSRVRGKQVVESALAGRNRYVLVDPMKGPVNVYEESARFANSKQRLMARIENPICPWEGCSVPATQSQVHHIQEVANGGKSTMDNLTTCCAHHNGANGVPGRGRLERIDGQVHWVPPHGGKPKLNSHPTAKLGAMRLVNA